jgi:hypothetical protein
MKRWIWVALGLSITLLVTFGCSPTAEDGGSGKIDRRTPDGLLIWLAVAYADKDLEAYEEALHDEFLFVFTRDVADSLGLPEGKPWWGKTKDVTSTEHMFNSSEVTRISMDYVPYGDRWVPCEETREDTVVYYGTCRRVIPDIQVTIDQGDEPLNLVVHDSFLDVVVVRDPKFPNQVLYVFLKIEEIPQNPS